MRADKVRTIGNIVILLVFIQILLFGMERCIFVFFERTDYSDHMASMFSMTVIMAIFIAFAKRQKVSLSVFPPKFGVLYVIATIVSAALLVTAPSNYTGEFQPVMLLIYSSIVTPVLEELIFRGYVWNKLNAVFTKEWKTYIVSTILFALWHLGYIDAIAFRTETGLAYAMLWKVITGLCFGVVLGAVRLKTKNSYSTILLHGVMNLFGR